MNNIQTNSDTQEFGNPAFSPLSILRTIWKRKLRIGAIWLLLTVLAFFIVRLLPAVYQAEALILVDSQKIPEKFVSPTVGSDLEDRIASIRQVLLSGEQLKKIIDEFDLYKDQRKTSLDEEILETMRKDISITLEPVESGLLSSGTGTTLKAAVSKNPNPAIAFRIGYEGSDPQLVTRVANRLGYLYVDENLKARESQALGTSEFLDTQLKYAKKELELLEAAVSKYKLEHNGELPEQEVSLGAALSRLQTELEANRDAINRAQQTRVILESNLSSLDATLSAQEKGWHEAQPGAAGDADTPGKEPARKASEIMEDQLALLRARYSDNYPDVVRLKADIEKVKRLETERETAAARAADPSHLEKAATNPPTKGKQDLAAKTVLREPADLVRTHEAVDTLRSQIKGSDKELQDRVAEQQRILGAIEASQRRMEHLPLREQEMAQLTRDYAIAKDNYKSLLDKKMAADMALDMERRQQAERFTLLDRARVPEKPIKPKRPMLYGLGSALALALALLTSFSVEMRKNVVLGEWELPEGTPVLARLPYIEVSVAGERQKPRARRRWFGRRKLFAEAAG